MYVTPLSYYSNRFAFVVQVYATIQLIGRFSLSFVYFENITAEILKEHSVLMEMEHSMPVVFYTTFKNPNSKNRTAQVAAGPFALTCNGDSCSPSVAPNTGTITPTS